MMLDAACGFVPLDLERLNLGSLPGGCPCAVVITFQHMMSVQPPPFCCQFADEERYKQNLISMVLAALLDGQVALTVAGVLLLSKVDDWQRKLACFSYSMHMGEQQQLLVHVHHVNLCSMMPHNGLPIAGAIIL